MNNWKETLAAVAPVLAAALGGPLAGVAVKVAADALGIKPDEDAVVDAVLSGNPEILSKLKQAEQAFKLAMKEAGIKLEEVHGRDRQSARSMAKISMLPQIILSTIYTVGYMVVLWQFLTGEVVIPAQSQAAFSIVLGVLTAAQTQILNFWFGSSSGSKEKTDLMDGKK